MSEHLSEKEVIQIAEAMRHVMQMMNPERKKRLHLLLDNYLELMDELKKIDEEVKQKIKTR